MKKQSGMNDQRAGQAPPGRARVHKRRRAQSLIEMALMLPLLVIMLTGVVDVGAAVSIWLRVNTAARDGARFALDAGRPDDTTSLVLNELGDMDASQINIYIVNGKTDANGNIPNSSPYWVVDHHYGAGAAQPGVTPSQIQTGLVSQSDPTANQNLPFVIVEVDLYYRPLLVSFFAPAAGIPMGNYALIQTPR